MNLHLLYLLAALAWSCVAVGTFWLLHQWSILSDQFREQDRREALALLDVATGEVLRRG